MFRTRLQDGGHQQAQAGGKAEADQRQVDRGRRGRSGHEEDIQPTSALHVGEGQECGHRPRLLLCAGPFGQGQSDL